MTMRPTVVVVSHTHWDREWYQPFEVFRLRLVATVEALLELLDRDARFACFMLDGQTVCLDDAIELAPALAPRIAAHVAAGRLTIGPWYVLQDEFLVGGESIVRNLGVGLASARRFGRAMRVGYLPDAFGHIAQMPRILRGFGLETAVVWRGVGERAPGSEWRWRAPSGAEVLCLFLPGGYGNAHRLGADDEAQARARLDADLANVMSRSRAAVMLWMNGNDHQAAEPGVPSVLEALGRARPDVAFEHASLGRADELVRARVDVAALPVVDGELLCATPTVPVLSGTWSARSWQKRDHDRAEALLVRFVEPFVALADIDRRDAIAHAWRLLLKCQPHDSICGCSVDEVHRDVDARLRAVDEVGRALVADAVFALVGARTADFALHEAFAVVNPHPFAASAAVEVSLQRPARAPFRVVGPTGEAAYEIVARAPTDGPDGKPAEWLRVRVDCRELPPHGLRVYALAPGGPSAVPAVATTLTVRAIPGGLAIVDGASGLSIEHTFVDEGDRGDEYDFCPRQGEPPRSSRDEELGVRVQARVVGRRVDVEATIDNRAPDHRLRARFAATPAPATMTTETAFGWLPRATPGTHPVRAVTATGSFAVGGLGLHEVERAADGALLVTLFRAVGWMSRGDLSTRPGHAGYNVQTPEAQGLGTLRFAYSLAIGPDAVRALDPGLVAPRAVALAHGEPHDRPLVSVEPAVVRLSILKRADDGDGLVVRLCGARDAGVTARVRLYRPITRACLSDLDERRGDALPVDGDEVAVPIAASDVVTLRIE